MSFLFFNGLFFLIHFFLHFESSKEEFFINITKIELPLIGCIPSTGKYYFFIYGNFSEKPDFFEDITIELETSDNMKLKSKCQLSDKIFNIPQSLDCDIEVYLYPLNNVDIIFPLKPPKIKGYTFLNWENTIGSEPGKSNVISNVICKPKEKNIFIPYSVELNGCNKKKNKFKIKGKWANNYNKPISSDLLLALAKIRLDNKNKDLAECEILDKIDNNTNNTDNNISDDIDFTVFECEFKGEGEINFKEQYFEVFLEIFKIKGFDSNIIANCDTSSNSSKAFLSKNEFVERLLYLVDQNTTYNGTSGFNILNYVNETFQCDCSGMIKALLNGFDIYNVKEGDVLRTKDYSVTKDLNSHQLINNCIEVSTNFSLLHPSEVRLLYMENHIGVYIGKEVACKKNVSGVCNVVECTSKLGNNTGIILSYVDDKGNRYINKNGTQSRRWQKHGLPPSSWLRYEDCDDISPQHPSDCLLSPDDKANYNSKYCCFDNIMSDTDKCQSFTEEEYKENFVDIFLECNVNKYNNNGNISGRIDINLTFLILLFILLI